MTAQRTDKQLLLDTGGPPIKVQQAGIDVFWGTLGEIIPDMWLPRKAALLHSMLTKRCKTNPTCTLLTMGPSVALPAAAAQVIVLAQHSAQQGGSALMPGLITDILGSFASKR